MGRLEMTVGTGAVEDRRTSAPAPGSGRDAESAAPGSPAMQQDISLSVSETTPAKALPRLSLAGTAGTVSNRKAIFEQQLGTPQNAEGMRSARRTAPALAHS